MKTITVQELQTLLQTQPEAAVLDVRSPAEYAALHLAGARNLPLSDLQPRTLAEDGSVSRVQPLYLMCQSGTRARLAAQQFTKDGFDNVVLVDGGIEAWRQAGFPLERGESGGGMSLERQVRIGAGSLVLLGVVLSLLVHPYFLGLSAFVGAGLVFAGVTDWCGMGLLLARAPWNTRVP